MSNSRIGQRIENYRLVRLLGSGGFAEVYLGQHIFLNDRHTAIKLLRARLPEDYEENFKEEALIIARLKHPHIIRIIDYGVEDAIPYLVMEYAENGTLARRYPKGQRVSLKTVVNYVTQIADALQYAHDHDLIHRDLKPENLLLGKDDKVLLSDFGIATLAHSTSSLETGVFAGTAPYSAPEQILGKPRKESDQYSLGIIAYQWLCGERPFIGTLSEITFQHLHAPPPLLREHVPGIPMTVEHVVLQALAKDYRDRFATVREFAMALQQVAIPTLPAQQLASRPEIAVQSPTQTPVMSQAQTPALSKEPGASVQITNQQPGTAVSHPSRRKLLIRLGFGLAGVVTLAGIGVGLEEITHAFTTVSPKPMLTAITTPIPAGTPIHTPAPTPTTSIALYTYTGHTQPVRSVAWSPNGKFIASGSADITVQVWDVATGNLKVTYKGHSDEVFSVAWSPDGKFIASSSADLTVQVWDAATGTLKITYKGHTQPVASVAWSPDGKSIASSSFDTTVQVWDAATGTLKITYKGHSFVVTSVAWSPDSKSIASGSADTTVQVWDAATGTLKATYKDPSNTQYANNIFSVAWSPDGKSVASGSADHRVQVWDVAISNLKVTYKGHSNGVNSVTWSPDSTKIASGSDDTTVQVWDAKIGTLKFTYKGHSQPVTSVAWSPDGKSIASGSTDKTVQIWQSP